MFGIRLKNIRSFRDTNYVKIRPVTLLVGGNSSGKSSFLRFFPLLRQSSDQDSQSPLLWYGNYVDFGKFQDVKCKIGESDSVSFGIEVLIDMDSYRRSLNHEILVGGRRVLRDDRLAALRIETTLIQEQEQTQVRRVALEYLDCRCEIRVGVNGTVEHVVVNGDLQIDSGRALRMTGDVIPVVSASNDLFDGRQHINRPAAAKLADVIKPMAHGKTSHESLLRTSFAVFPFEAEQMVQHLSGLHEAQKWKREIEQLHSNPKKLRRIRGLALAVHSFGLLRAANQFVRALTRDLAYLGPFRQDPQRYYRQQELSVTTIEPHGENLAMFLRSLSARQRQEFADFTNELFGFEVGVVETGGHVEITVAERNGNVYNLIDMGYGTSQVLPVLAQCWSFSNSVPTSGRNSRPRIVAIEQPELHLHPSHQASLANMLHIMSSKSGIVRGTVAGLAMPRTSFIIETHSEALVNRIGELVAEKKLDANDVAVLLFSKDETGESTVVESSFEEDGTLTNWPIGFFAP